MRNKLLSVLALLTFTHAASHADVIYDWTSLDTNLPHGISLSLVFTDAAVASGAASLGVPAGDYNASYPNSPLVSLTYSAPGINAMTYRPGDGKFNNGLGILDLFVNFTTDGYLTGWIRANDASSNFEMRSDGKVMTVLDARSDQWMGGAGCGFDLSTCNGATGFVRRSGDTKSSGAADVAVPEPATLGLLAAGAAAFALRRRRPRAAKPAHS